MYMFVVCVQGRKAYSLDYDDMRGVASWKVWNRGVDVTAQDRRSWWRSAQQTGDYHGGEAREEKLLFNPPDVDITSFASRPSSRGVNDSLKITYWTNEHFLTPIFWALFVELTVIELIVSCHLYFTDLIHKWLLSTFRLKRKRLHCDEVSVKSL